MSFNQKIMDTKLRGIQLGVDEAGNKLFAQHTELGSELKKLAFDVGMVRATLKEELAQLTSNSDYTAVLDAELRSFTNFGKLNLTLNNNFSLLAAHLNSAIKAQENFA